MWRISEEISADFKLQTKCLMESSKNLLSLQLPLDFQGASEVRDEFLDQEFRDWMMRCKSWKMRSHDHQSHEFKNFQTDLIKVWGAPSFSKMEFMCKSKRWKRRSWVEVEDWSWKWWLTSWCNWWWWWDLKVGRREVIIIMFMTSKLWMKRRWKFDVASSSFKMKFIVNSRRWKRRCQSGGWRLELELDDEHPQIKNLEIEKSLSSHDFQHLSKSWIEDGAASSNSR